MKGQHERHYKILSFMNKPEFEDEGAHRTRLEEVEVTNQLTHTWIIDGNGELYKYIRQDKEGYFKITDSGKAYLSELQSEKRKEDKQNSFELKKFWIPIGISLLSLSVTAISQYYSSQKITQLQNKQEQIEKYIMQSKTLNDSLYFRLERLEGSIKDTAK